jgi:uncharacterized protein with PQ loop repeat
MTDQDCKACCKKCHDCEECKKDEVNLWSGAEILGYVSILIGMIGVFFQVKKSGTERNFSSFSVIYLAFATLAELIFMVQGIVNKNVSLTITKIAGASYFGFLFIMFLIYELGGKKKKKK